MAGWEELHRLLRRAEEVARRIEQSGWEAPSGTARDPLFGCYPRGYLADRLPAELARAGRFGRSLAVAVLHFEESPFDAAQAHGWRDALAASLDLFDLPVRFDEHRLVLLLPEVGKEEAAQKAERLAGALVLSGVAGRLPAVAVAHYPEQGLTASELLEALEREVERARAGRGPAMSMNGAHRNGYAPHLAASGGPSEALVAVGFSADRRLPVSFWRGESLHLIRAILSDETTASGSRRFSVLTDRGEFLLFERDGRWYAEPLLPRDGEAGPPADGAFSEA